MYAIETNHLRKQFGSYEAVHSLDLKIPYGFICGFLGKNGAGKTTTLKMLIGLMRPSSGEVIVLGKKREFGKIDNSTIGYLSDVPDFYHFFTAREYLEFCGKLYGIDKKECNKKIDEILEKVDLQDSKNPITNYSRGMKQRLGIASVLIHSPQIIILDEPISALDPIGRHEIMQLIQSLRGSLTVFFSTHVLSDVETTCDHAVILEHGRLIVSDTIDMIKKKYARDMAVLKLSDERDCNSFLHTISNYKEIDVQRMSVNELKLHIFDFKSFNRKLPELLYQSLSGLECYEIISPTLEDIFMEVTKDE